MTQPDDLITPKEAGLIIGVSANTIRRYIRRKLLRSYVIAGARKRVSERDVRALVVLEGGEDEGEGENEQEVA